MRMFCSEDSKVCFDLKPYKSELFPELNSEIMFNKISTEIYVFMAVSVLANFQVSQWSVLLSDIDNERTKASLTNSSLDTIFLYKVLF